MILIADSGSTKTDWAAISLTENPIFFQSKGYNPYFVDALTIASTLSEVLPKTIDTNSVKEIFFFGAGCFDFKRSIIENGLKTVFKNAHISVDIDLKGAAVALLGNQPGFAGIIGTGTNSCLFDGKNIIQNIDSLGYILGDEGSGSYIGKKLLADFIRGYMPKKLRDLFEEKYKQTKENIYENLYQSKLGTKYCASFVPFLKDYPTIEATYQELVLTNCFEAFFNNLVAKYPNYKEYSFNCVGSIAYHFKAPLIKVANQFGMAEGKILKSPIDGLVSHFSENQ
jgi:glucosamine kinase